MNKPQKSVVKNLLPDAVKFITRNNEYSENQYSCKRDQKYPARINQSTIAFSPGKSVFIETASSVFAVGRSPGALAWVEETDAASFRTSNH